MGARHGAHTPPVGAQDGADTPPKENALLGRFAARFGGDGALLRPSSAGARPGERPASRDLPASRDAGEQGGGADAQSGAAKRWAGLGLATRLSHAAAAKRAALPGGLFADGSSLRAPKDKKLRRRAACGVGSDAATLAARAMAEVEKQQKEKMERERARGDVDSSWECPELQLSKAERKVAP